MSIHVDGVRCFCKGVCRYDVISERGVVRFPHVYHTHERYAYMYEPSNLLFISIRMVYMYLKINMKMHLHQTCVFEILHRLIENICLYNNVKII